MKSSGLGQRMWLHGRDISGDVGSLQSLATPKRVIDNVQGIDSSAVQRLLAHGDGLLGFNGWFNTAADQLHDALSGLPTTDLVTIVAMSTTRGAAAYALVGKLVDHAHNRPADGSLQISASLEANGPPGEWGVMVTAGSETVASAGSLTSLDENGDDENTALGCSAVLEYISLTSGTPTTILEDSPDDSAWATLITFTATPAPVGQRLTVTGNVDAHLRMTLTGTFVNAKIACMFRRGTAADDEDLS